MKNHAVTCGILSVHCTYQSAIMLKIRYNGNDLSTWPYTPHNLIKILKTYSNCMSQNNSHHVNEFDGIYTSTKRAQSLSVNSLYKWFTFPFSQIPN